MAVKANVKFRGYDLNDTCVEILKIRPNGFDIGIYSYVLNNETGSYEKGELIDTEFREVKNMNGIFASAYNILKRDIFQGATDI